MARHYRNHCHHATHAMQKVSEESGKPSPPMASKVKYVYFDKARGRWVARKQAPVADKLHMARIAKH